MFPSLLLKLAGLILLTTCWNIFAFGSDNVPKLPHCVENEDFGFVLISTIDGKLTSLHGTTGDVLWEVETGPGPLLTSSIHNFELTNNGERVRIIPSLKGGLYKFNGKTIDAIPINADNLLKSSHFYSSNLVIAGSRDVRTYGVNANNGKMIYECSAAGCMNKTGTDINSDNMVVIERSTTTVRAHEPRTGIERWNFSVGHHNIRIPPSDCLNIDSQITQLNLTVLLPKGIIYASKSGTLSKLWNHEFSAPIVNVWKWNGKDLIPVDVFSQIINPQHMSLPPALYLGMHEKQLYIDESNRLMNSDAFNTPVTIQQSNNLVDRKSVARIPWKPIAAYSAEHDEQKNDLTASYVLHNSENVDGNGYYFYEFDVEKKNTICIKNTTKAIFEEYFSTKKLYLKEVFLILITTIVVAKLFWDYGSVRFFALLRNRQMEDERNRHLLESLKESNNSSESKVDQVLEPSDGEAFTSRFLKDFETVSCLGQGGYGVVYEVKQKIDEFGYAIKRITLPQEPSSQKRVLREVKALAKLDHINIVRYCTSWVERPPPEWRHQFDRQFMSENSRYSTESKQTTQPTNSHRRSNSTVISIASNEISTCETSDSFQIEFEHSQSNGHSTESLNESTSYTSSKKETTVSKAHSTFQIEIVDTYLYIQMQLCKKESLKDWLGQNYTREKNKIYNIYNQILSAVEYVHKQKLIHRDLKPSNVFFSLDENVKIGDFGLVTTMKCTDTDYSSIDETIHSHTKDAGTFLYMSPEQIERKDYNYKVDIFSLGVMLFELIVPFMSGSERIKTLTDLRNDIYPVTFHEEHPKEYKLLKKMLSKYADERPDVAHIKVTLNEDKESHVKAPLSLPNNFIL